MELQGRIVRVLGETSGTNQQGNPWRKLEYLFGYYENPSDIYERNIVLSYMNDHMDQNKGYQENDQVKVRVAMTCREYPQGSGRYFNDIRCGDLQMIQRANGTAVAQQNTQQDGGTGAAPAPSAPTTGDASQGQGQSTGEGGADDLPF